MSTAKPKASDFTVTFRGVRGNHATPDRDKMVYGGNTTCVEVRAGRHLLILDAGTGLIPLGIGLMKDITVNGGLTATLLFTHTHQDHVQGFPFFKPAYLPSSELFIFGPRVLQSDLEECLEMAMLPANFPVELAEMTSMQYIRTVGEENVISINGPNGRPEILDGHTAKAPKASEVRISILSSMAHPKSTVFIYRITWKGRSVVFATDIEGYKGGDARLIAFAEGADLLIHDAQFDVDDYTDPEHPRQGWGHSTWEMATDVAKQANVGRLALFHYDPAYSDDRVSDIEARAKRRFRKTIAAREGLTLTL